jgi:hypothetical protein
MSTVKGLRAGMTAGILLGMLLGAGTVRAQGNFSTERPASILIFPKVVNTTPDTIVQITNTSNNLVNAHCFYTDGRSVNGVPVWQVTDFELTLTRQQPTHWSVADGRAVNPMDSTNGLDPGLIPPVPPGFTGFLVCVETLADGTPSSANSLKGEATIGQVTSAGGANGVGKYNAIGIPGCNGPQGPCGASGQANNGDNILSLDGQEYAACPGGLYMNYIGEGAEDPAIAGTGNNPSVVSNSLTVVPCGMDFENLRPTSTTLSLAIRNEFEENLSVFPVDVDCWFESSFSDPPLSSGALSESTLGSTFGKAIIRPPVGAGLTPVLGVLNTLHTAGDGSSDTSLMNLQFCTDVNPPAQCIPFNSEIRLPSEP